MTEKSDNGSELGKIRRTPDGGIEVEYDVTHVDLPFPLRDPEVGPTVAEQSDTEQMELPPELAHYRLYTAEQLGMFPPVSWLIDGYLAVGELTGLYGQGGAFKSFLALDWACHLASQGHVVVYIVAEGASGMKARIGAWKELNGIADLSGLFLMPSNVALHDPQSVQRWLAAMRLQLGGRQPALVVVDTLARNFVGGSESDPRDMGLFVEGAERIRLGLQTAVLVLHHTTKDGNSERGTLALRNASFAMFKLTRKGGAGIGSADLTCDRMKDAEEPPNRRIAPQRVELPALGEGIASLVSGWAYSPGYSPGGAGDNGRKSGDYSGDYSPDEKALLRAISRANTRANTAVLTKALRWSPTKLQATVKPLLKRDVLFRHGKGRSTFYTDAAGERGDE